MRLSPGERRTIKPLRQTAMWKERVGGEWKCSVHTTSVIPFLVQPISTMRETSFVIGAFTERLGLASLPGVTFLVLDGCPLRGSASSALSKKALLGPSV